MTEEFVVFSPVMRASFSWRPGLFEDWERAKQKAVEYMVVRSREVVEPYVPFETGKLRRTAYKLSRPKEGLLRWGTEYARAQYFMVRVNPGPGLEGPYWFSRMWETWGLKIMDEAAEAASGEL